MEVVILKHHKLPVSAASGVEVYNDQLYVISDNTEGISVCNLEGELLFVIPLSDEVAPHEIIEKKHKSDYEACSIISRNNSDYILLIGSGSTRTNRNKAKLVSLAERNKVETFDLTRFYKELRKKSKISIYDFNLEALAEYDGNFYFFNRGTNEIISMKQVAFFYFIHDESDEFQIKKFGIELDAIDGASAGFSGAEIANNGMLVFTASAEETTDWYNDGAIAGSSIGFFPISELGEQGKIKTIPLQVDGNIVKTKIESVAIQFIDSQKANLFLVSDNDGSDSELFEVMLYFD
jgi:hypothetical protein